MARGDGVIYSMNKILIHYGVQSNILIEFAMTIN